jgi:hypothetical protein
LPPDSRARPFSHTMLAVSSVTDNAFFDII